jgi:hypothetical protein
LRRGERGELGDRIHPHTAFEAVAIRNGKSVTSWR